MNRTGMRPRKQKAALLPQRNVTPRYIAEVKARYHLSWSDMDARMGYAKASRLTYHTYSHPERFLNDCFKKKFRDMVAQLEQERGHAYEITFGENVRRLVRAFRVTHQFQKCRGHRVPCTWVDEDGFCGEECKRLYARRARA